MPSKYDKFKIGDKVTLKEGIFYYSDPINVLFPDGTTPVRILLVEPGMVGTVGAIRVPCASHTKGNPTEYLCIDYKIEDVSEYRPRYKGSRARIRPWYHEVELVLEG